ncbi:DUF484 family protein [Teredinibacter sp. KSP-S5-2]|uniref:DUF484 family protein n=1 Tax=Teredinibacter sp. KSP-S5-2 TaxID=3034506 RepID=UPI0029343D66|nr:DUF484 family protein [Teredinibacter sp. KSP-S5-2]WNO09002.1 DUF484 family protein [Teredinibacter sp. KSP-S5-2]
MSDSNLTDTKTPIREEDISFYLRSHLNFFESHPDLLSELRLPHASGGAVSLVERQVSILRERNMEMRQRLSNLLDNARDNDRLFDKTKRLVLALLECNELGDLVDALYYSFDKEFGIHYTRLVLFSSKQLDCGAARQDSVFNAREHVGKRLKSPRAVSGGLDIREIQYLFDNDSPNIGSAALAVLIHGTPIGLLAIGNQDPKYYNSGMGTLFLSYIAEVLNRLLPKYL